ncbi:MAG: shikimate kinase [Bacillota bacterium]|nr:shikimate kinase [Bacillota bacterium]
MTIFLFGLSNVGKTTIGEKLAQRLGYVFYDLDEEVKKYYDMTLEEFVNTGSLNERDKKRGFVISEIMESSQNKIIAITPIYYSSNFNKHISRKDVLAIELQDLPENIFQRLVFSDENDEIYKDDEYKNLHKKHYISEIKKDQTCYKRSFSKVKNKFHIDNDSVEMVIERIIKEYKLMPI